MGSLVEVLLPIIMVVDVFSSGTFTAGDMPFHAMLIGAIVVMRALPFFLWILSNKTRRQCFHLPIFVISRLNNVFITLQFLLMLQLSCLDAHCQLVRTLLLDVLVVVLLVEPLLKPLRFALHVPVALLELAVATYTLSSPLGVCGALQTLAHPDSAASDAMYIASNASWPGCATRPTIYPPPFHQQLGPLLRPVLDWTLHAMRVPSGGYLETGPALVMAGQQRCQVLGSAIQAASKLLVRAVGWLTVGTLSLSAPMEGQRVCGELALVAIVLFACVACVLYHMEACRRCQWWRARHSNRVLQPPLPTLRMLLLVQHTYVLLGVLAVASVPLMARL